MKLKDGVPPAGGTSNVVPMHRAPKTGRLTTMSEYYAAAKAYVAYAGAMVPLNALHPEDAKALAAWAGYLHRLGQGTPNLITFAQEALSTRDAMISMPTRWPSEMTGIPGDDRHGCTDAG